MCRSTDSHCSNAGGTRPTEFLKACRTAPPMYSAIPRPPSGQPAYRKSTAFFINVDEKEGDQATFDPFDNEACPPCRNENGYTAIAFVNRFDLADKESGRHCGEFRIIFAKNSGLAQVAQGTGDRNLIIFEALVPNPSPDPRVKPTPDNPFAKLEGCRPIVEFWLSLSNTVMTTEARGKALHDFFLKGLPKDSVAKGLPKHDIGPIVDTRHYAGGPASGQIRTNQFMERNWTLREFKTYGGSIVPATVKSNPGNDLFSSFAAEDPRKRELEDYLVRQDVLDNLRGIRGEKGAVGERSIFTFAFGLTTAGLDHLNSFDSMAESETMGMWLRLLIVAAGVPSETKSRKSSPHHSMPTTLYIDSELRRVRDAIAIVTATRSSGWIVLQVGRINFALVKAAIEVASGQTRSPAEKTDSPM